jgi:hypothetical protein
LEMSEQLKYNSNFENKCISCSKKEYGFQLWTDDRSNEAGAWIIWKVLNLVSKIFWS